MSSGEDPILDPLNPAQREAVTHGGGPLLVVAGPGSGKTRVVAHRIAWLVERHGVAPSRILAMTFTNKAAQEMARRVEALLGRPVTNMWVSTFHRAALRVLRTDGPQVDVPREFHIYDEDDQRKIMRDVLKSLLGERAQQVSEREVLRVVLWCKRHGITPKGAADRGSDLWEDSLVSRPYLQARERLARQEGFDFERILPEAYTAYQGRLSAAHALDFDDLLLGAERLFRESPDACHRYARRFLHVLVDEYQDTDHLQYQLLRHFTSVHHNLTAVGDPDQAIYGWRGADVRNIRRFEQDFPGAHMVLLEHNYRSTQTILSVADAIISASPAHPSRRLWTDRGPGERVRVHTALEGVDEADFVFRSAQQLHAAGYAWRDIAILYRANAQSRPFEEVLVRAGVPHRLLRSLPFYERREVKDILAYLRLVVNPHDALALWRVINLPPRGIGDQTARALRNWTDTVGGAPLVALGMLADGAAAAPGIGRRQMGAVAAFHRLWTELVAACLVSTSVVDAFQAIIQATAYEAYLASSGPAEFSGRWDHVQQLLAAAAEYESRPEANGVRGFLEETALMSDADQYDPDADVVTLSTIHAAKGLEWSAVFLTGMEEGSLPLRGAEYDPMDGENAYETGEAPDTAGTDEDLDEERRLCFVAVTRAKDLLFLTHAEERFSYGEWADRPQSRFLRTVPKKLTIRVSS